jgi:hypothetical protein
VQPFSLLAGKVQLFDHGRDAGGAFVVVFGEVDAWDGSTMPLSKLTQCLLDGTLRVEKVAQERVTARRAVQARDHIGELARILPEAFGCPYCVSCAHSCTHFPVRRS